MSAEPAEEVATESKTEEKESNTKKEEPPEDKEKKKTGKKGLGKKNPSGPTASGGYRLNVKNFTKETIESSEKLRSVFEPFGKVIDAQIKSRDGGKPLGLGFVVMALEEDATKAIAELNDKEFDGKKLVVAPAERRVDDNNQWLSGPSGYPDLSQFYSQMVGGKGKGKGKGKEKGKAMMQQYVAMQTAYATAYSQVWSARMGATDDKGGGGGATPADEQVAPGEFTGVLKYRMRYGQKKSYIVCHSTYQYYGSDVHIEKETIPAEAKDGDSIRFTVAAAYGEAKWDDKTGGWSTPYAKGYPKAKTARLVQASKAEEEAK